VGDFVPDIPNDVLHIHNARELHRRLRMGKERGIQNIAGVHCRERLGALEVSPAVISTTWLVDLQVVVACYLYRTVDWLIGYT